MENTVGKKRNFSKEDKNNFLQMYNKGISLREIAKKYNTSHSVIRNNIKKDIIQRPKSLIFDKKIQEEIKNAYLNGASLSSLVERFKEKKIQRATIQRFLANENLYIANVEDLKHADIIPELYKFLELGQSLGEISKTLNVPKATLSNYVRFTNDIPDNYYDKMRHYDLDLLFFKNASIKTPYELGFLVSNMVLCNRCGIKAVDFYCEGYLKEEFNKIKEKFTNKSLVTAYNYKKEKYVLSCISKELYQLMGNFSAKDLEGTETKRKFFYGYIKAGTNTLTKKRIAYIKFKNKDIAMAFIEFLKLENTELYNKIFPMLKEHKNSISIILYSKKMQLLMNFLEK